MSRSKILMYIAAAVVSILLLQGCGGQETTENQNEQVLSVRTHLVQPSNLELIDTYTGTLYGKKQAVLYAKITESINEIYVEETDRVKSGTILLKFDSTGPGSGYLEAKSLYENARKNYKKMEYLYSEGAVSETEYDAAKTDYEVRRASYEAASQLINIESPIDGIVTNINISEGDYVTAGSQLITIAQTDTIRAKFEVGAEKIASLKKGSTVYIEDEISGKQYRGLVSSVPQSADPLTRTYLVEAVFDNSSGSLQPGTFVRVKYINTSLDNVIIIPRKAVLLLNEQPVVYLVKGESAITRNVELGVATNGNVRVTSGLTANDTLVTVGQEYLEDSSLVNITAWEE